MSILIGKETKIIIPDNAFPSDGGFKRKNTETYLIESRESKDVEFILKVSEKLYIKIIKDVVNGKTSKGDLLLRT